MNQKRLSIIMLIAFPIFSLCVVFFCLYLFSNVKVTTDFVYFEQNNYSSQNSINIVDNKITFGESDGYKKISRELEAQKKSFAECQSKSANEKNGVNCQNNFPMMFNPPPTENNPPPKIYLYSAQKNISKQIDLETAKTLNLVPEKQNDAGETFSSPSCGNSGGPFMMGGYYGNCGNIQGQILVKKGTGSKTIDLETGVNIDLESYPGVIVNSGQRNIYWVR